MLCTLIQEADGDVCLEGISLIDGSWPRSCSVTNCGPIPMTLEEAVAARQNFALHLERRNAEIN